MIPIITYNEILCLSIWKKIIFRSSHPEVFLRKVDLNICSKFTGEYPCRSVISNKLLCNFIEITIRHGYSPVNLLNIFRTPFHRNTSRWLLLYFIRWLLDTLLQGFLITFHFSSFILHYCLSKIKLIIYNNIYKKQSKMFKFVNLKLLQEFCQTYISLAFLWNCSSYIFPT